MQSQGKSDRGPLGGREEPPGTGPTPEGTPAAGSTRSSLCGGIRARLLLLVALAVLPALAVIGYSGYQDLARTRHAAREQVKTIARRIGRHEARRIRKTHRLLSVLGTLPQIRAANPSQCQSLLAALLAREPQYANFALIAADGHVVCSAVEVGHPVVPSREAFFRRVFLTRAFSLGNYEVGQMTGVPVLVAAYPLLNPKQQVTAVLIAAMKLTWLKELPNYHLPPDALLTVLDPGGQILFRHRSGPQWAGNPRLRSSLERTLRTVPATRVFDTRGANGQALINVLSRVRGFGRAHDPTVVVQVPARVAYAQTYRVIHDELLILTLITTLVFVLAWAGGNMFMMRPIETLLAATRRIAAGDLSARTGIRRGAIEVCQLAANFDDMATSLERYTQELIDRNRRVERLNRIHRVLSGINSALLRIRERDALLSEVCRIAADRGGFRLAWIGMADPNNPEVAPAASAGPAADAIEGIKVSRREDVPEGHGVIGRTLRSGTPTVCNDVENDPHVAPWRDLLLAAGLKSVAAFPLQVQQRVIGVLAFYSGEPGFFDSEELRLLNELAANAGLGLEYIDQEHQLRYLAYYDPLTGLANRALFQDRLGQVLARARRTGVHSAILALEMAQFHKVLDTLGRHAGDAVLRELGARLTRIVRTHDTVARVGTETVARLSGATFAVLLEDIKYPHEAEIVAQRMLKTIRDPVNLEAETVVLDAHVGIAFGPEDSEDPDTLLAHAELALHSLDPGGTERVRFYAPELNIKTRERHELEQGLRQAIERDEFTLYYQPQVGLKDGNIVGVEALLRWRHPEKGLISPAVFIPILEETGLIIVVGDWVLRTACAEQVAWMQATGVAVNMAVNISAHQFRDENLPVRIGEIVDRTGIDPRHLELEITESVFMDHVGRTLKVLETFKSEGIRLSIDDFGTGYSSLGYLREFPVDVLKIDQSFVRGMTGDPDRFVIARSVVALAHGLGMRVIAEGVETEGQLRLLASEDCDAVQGYFFSRPVPSPELLHLLRAGANYPLPKPPARDGEVTVVILADGPDVETLKRALDGNAYRIIAVGTSEEAFEALAVNRPTAIVAGAGHADATGEEFMRRVSGIYPDVARIRLIPAHSPGTGAGNRGAEPAPDDLSIPLEREVLREWLGKAVSASRKRAPSGSVRDGLAWRRRDA
ncbi:MAG: EAL domain-containing protein [Acidiferrobacteraceae bacterium]